MAGDQLGGCGRSGRRRRVQARTQGSFWGRAPGFVYRLGPPPLLRAPGRWWGLWRSVAPETASGGRSRRRGRRSPPGSDQEPPSTPLLPSPDYEASQSVLTVAHAAHADLAASRAPQPRGGTGAGEGRGQLPAPQLRRRRSRPRRLRRP